ncbi:MAG TPA: hypothetical protein DF296_01605 [Candidatus Margulisbacteria bacterium]|nr:MAG: hypothetical protein A2X43_08850 [Candidatus Margulisbacteria bacterium GWD2_39_127]OGI01465.1 MAG: hypothetical protein A2X42_09875 [Candidatus Margulisbacteria bacterium GWF2_38_17]OGI10714.1 MAG: hypothetical protein A2X41_06310 [Candidatus Margulisbacteria bacterium GWE2_39_32]HAR63271.1 hypothetical protein [Candidatus Margulisiibacteriota bacterium]HCT83873.1 hypothetical protein [Candidatus Margulisiibacteriota bacterium]
MDILELLKNDHDTIREMISELIGISEERVQERVDLFSELEKELRLHTKAEEDVYYPYLERNDDTRQNVYEAIEEHAVIEWLVEQLENRSVLDERWTAQLKVLDEIVEHHLQEEERDLFEATYGILNQEQREEVGSRFSIRKAEGEDEMRMAA